jgi:hypothetical protein
VNKIAEEILRRIPEARSKEPEFLHFENRVSVETRRIAI